MNEEYEEYAKKMRTNRDEVIEKMNETIKEMVELYGEGRGEHLKVLIKEHLEKFSYLCRMLGAIEHTIESL